MTIPGPRHPAVSVLAWLAVMVYGAACMVFLQRLLLHSSPQKLHAPSHSVLLVVDPPLAAEPLQAAPDVAMRPRAGAAPSGGGLESAYPAQPSAALDTEPSVPIPQVAIIIDDIGYQWQAGKRSIELAGHVTLALLPFSPYALQLAQLAEGRGKELMLHAPMEPEAHPSWDKGLDSLMDEQTIRSELAVMLASLPMVKGVNNHMGSALTQRSDTMAWVMDELAQRGLYFIDSRTSAHSTALEQAQFMTLPSARRDIFLDNIRTPQAIQHQFDKLLLKAQNQGSAIAIGHPYPETLAFLENALPQLTAQGVQLVPVSSLLERNMRRDLWRHQAAENGAASAGPAPHTHL